MAFLEDAIGCYSPLPETITIFRATFITNLDIFMWIRQGVAFRVRKKRISLSQSSGKGSCSKSALRGVLKREGIGGYIGGTPGGAGREARCAGGRQWNILCSQGVGTL